MKKKISLYVETVIPEYDDITFRRMFRLKRSSVEILLQEIGGRLIYEEPLRGRPSLCPEKQKTGFHNSVVPGHSVNRSYDGGQIWRN